MSERSTLARPYADAVFRMAKEAGDLAGWSARLKTLVTIAKDARVARVINDPTVSTERLADFMIEVAGKVLGEEGGNLIKVLAENARLALLPEVAAQFENLKADDEGVVEATITSAQALTQAQIADLAGALKAKFKRDVTVKVAVDESLIGGAVIAVGDKVIDGSVKGRLERMSYALQA